jgi:hypothetical protein
MARHKHVPKTIKMGSDDGVEECTVCKSRRYFIDGSGRVANTHYKRWWKNKTETNSLYKGIWDDAVELSERGKGV